MDITGYFKILDIEPTTSGKKVNDAYRDLASVWHPDRFSFATPRLKMKAEQKMKDLNQAKDIIMKTLNSEQTNFDCSGRSYNPASHKNHHTYGSDDDCFSGSASQKSDGSCGVKHSLRSQPVNMGETSPEFQKIFFLEHNYNAEVDREWYSWCSKLSIENNFSDNQNGTITDQSTGLMWQKSGSENTLNFQNAYYYIQSLNYNRYCGYSDWRLPTLEELLSLWCQWKKEHYYRRREYIGEVYVEPFIDQIFDARPAVCWSSDIPTVGVKYRVLPIEEYKSVKVRYISDAAWCLNYGDWMLTAGNPAAIEQRIGLWVKAVRCAPMN